MEILDYGVELLGEEVKVYDAVPLNPPVHSVILLHGRQSTRWVLDILGLTPPQSYYHT